MERKIEITVRVSDEEHARIIRDEIEAAVRKRTTIYYISLEGCSTHFLNSFSPNEKLLGDE